MSPNQRTLSQRELPRAIVLELFLRIEQHLGILDSDKDSARRECGVLAARLAAYGDEAEPSEAYVKALEDDAEIEADEQRPATKINTLAAELGNLVMRMSEITAAFRAEKQAMEQALEAYEGTPPTHTAAGTPLHPED